MVDSEVISSDTLTVTLPSVSITGFRTALINNDGVVFRWDAVTNAVAWDYTTKRPFTGGYRYHIERAETRYGEYSRVGETDAELTFTDNSASFFQGGTYFYRLSVMVNTTVFSSEPIEVILQSVSIPGFQVIAMGQESVSFMWDTVNNVQSWDYNTRLKSSSWRYYYHGFSRFKVPLIKCAS